jgi:type IV pilus assembly protein PilW
MAMQQPLGMSLIELMVALTLSLVLIGGVIQVFVSNKTTYKMQEGVTNMEENARFALEMIARDIRMAGYVGCRRSVNTVNILVNSAPDSFRPALGLQGWEAADTAPGDATYSLDPTVALVDTAGTDDNWSNSTADPIVDSGDISVMPGSDVIRIWRGGDKSPVSLASVSPPSTLPQSLTMSDEHGIAAGKFAILSDCQSADIIQVCGGTTNINLAGCSGSRLGNVDNRPVSAYANGSEAIELLARTYFIGKLSGNANQPPALFLAKLAADGEPGSQVEIARGVENLQLLYGLDTDGDGSADSFVTAESVSNPAQVISVQIGLLVSSPDRVGATNSAGPFDVIGTSIEASDDKRLRRVYSTTVLLRNRLG